MSSGMYGILAGIFWSVAVILILYSVYLFFKLKVKILIDDLSGRKAAREIRAYRDRHSQAAQNTACFPTQDTVTKILSEGAVMEISCEETEVLPGTDTLVLDQEEQTGRLENHLILDEIVIHTMEKI